MFDDQTFAPPKLRDLVAGDCQYALEIATNLQSKKEEVEMEGKDGRQRGKDGRQGGR